MMADTMDVPAVGNVDKRWLIAGGALTAGIVGYAWWRNGRTAPAPGEGELSPDDLAYAPDAYSGAVIPGGSTVVGTVEPQGDPKTNAEWSQRLVDALENVGFERNYAALTIGKYLSGQQLTTAEALMMQTAIAILGNPPAGALPILKFNNSPNGNTPNPAPSTNVVWQGYRLPVNTNWAELAKKFSASPKPDAIESTKRAIMSRNPTVLNYAGKAKTSVLRKGWIVYIPVHK